ncbi:MAG: hypothetical protein IPM82_20615 [Saprospiraceae bacterium]|nr:hypothetical protein [Saprospiraceae bacterium]
MNDNTSNSNNGTAPNGITYTTDRFGNCNQAAKFNGTNAYVTAAASASLNSPSTGISLMGWAKAQLSTANIQSIICKSLQSTSTLHYRLGVEGAGLNRIFFGYRMAGQSWGNNYSSQLSNLTITDWNQYAVTWDGATVRFYWNGAAVGSATLSGTIQPNDTTAPFELGRDVHGGIENFNGDLDEIRVYNRALSATEILSLFNAPGNTPLSAAVSSLTPACSGQSNGSATATASGGTTPYTFKWSNNQMIATATNLSAGTYTVTITGGNGCTATATATVGTAAAPNATVSATVPACAGQSTGSATATASGGATPYTFKWSNNQMTATATNLSAGTYTVTITGSNGCTATATAIIGTMPATSSNV